MGGYGCVLYTHGKGTKKTQKLTVILDQFLFYPLGQSLSINPFVSPS